MTDVLVSIYDLGRLDVSDPIAVSTSVDEVLNHQERQFWQVPWKGSSYDTKVGRTLIVQSLVQIARNIRSGVAWFEDVEMLDAAEIEAMGE
jgi:hypothetical protein